jgi:hypothetical protein
VPQLTQDSILVNDGGKVDLVICGSPNLGTFCCEKTGVTDNFSCCETRSLVSTLGPTSTFLGVATQETSIQRSSTISSGVSLTTSIQVTSTTSTQGPSSTSTQDPLTISSQDSSALSILSDFDMSISVASIRRKTTVSLTITNVSARSSVETRSTLLSNPSKLTVCSSS